MLAGVITKAGIHFDGFQKCTLSKPSGDKKSFVIVEDKYSFESACALFAHEKDHNSDFAAENAKATAYLTRSLKALEDAESSYQGASQSFANMLVHFGDAHFPGFVDAQMMAVFKATYFEVLSVGGAAVSAGKLKLHVKNFVEYRVKAHNLEMYDRHGAFLHSKDVSQLKGAKRGGGGVVSTLSVPRLLDIEHEVYSSSSESLVSFFSKSSLVPEMSKVALEELKSIDSVSGSRYPIQIETPIGPKKQWSELQLHTQAVHKWWLQTFHVGASKILECISDVPENRRNGLFLNQCCLEEHTVLYLQGRLVERLRLSPEQAEYAVHKDTIWSLVPEDGDLWRFANNRPHGRHAVLANRGGLLIRAKTTRKCWPQAEFFLGDGRSTPKPAEPRDVPSRMGKGALVEPPDNDLNKALNLSKSLPHQVSFFFFFFYFFFFFFDFGFVVFFGFGFFFFFVFFFFFFFFFFCFFWGGKTIVSLVD